MTRVDLLMTAQKPWPADAGLETAMLFLENLDLPNFAAFPLLHSTKGREALTRWFEGFLPFAKAGGTGFVLDTVTWRANMGWAAAMGLDAPGLRQINSVAVDFAMALRDRHETATLPILINGVVGPSGDGYHIDRSLSVSDAEVLHLHQIAALADAGADMVSAVTMTHAAEAIGIALAAKIVGLPHVLSFTVETDGRLPSGQGLAEAIAEVDAATGASALFFMVNCAHPTHFSAMLDGDFCARIGGVRANASRQSHAELDVATALDDGDPSEFGTLYAGFKGLLPNLRIIGGCCGSDHRHVGAACAHLHV
ncbi:MAG: homocysteine S-methyltransferase family protein [Pseudomonadota bacterium]